MVRTLTFGAGVRTLSVPVTIVNDSLVEGNETVNLQLSNPRFLVPGPPLAIATANCVPPIGPVCTVPLTIVDDDQGGVIQFKTATYAVTEGTLNATITLARTGGTGRSGHGGLRHRRRHRHRDGRRDYTSSDGSSTHA